jgi:hypothetical protein
MQDSNSNYDQETNQRAENNPPQTYWQARKQQLGGTKGIAIIVFGSLGIALSLLGILHGVHLYFEERNRNTKTVDRE